MMEIDCHDNTFTTDEEIIEVEYKHKNSLRNNRKGEIVDWLWTVKATTCNDMQMKTVSSIVNVWVSLQG